MFRYVLRRIAAIVPILFGVSVVCFSFIHLAPGDAITALAGDNASAVVLERMRQATDMTSRFRSSICAGWEWSSLEISELPS